MLNCPLKANLRYHNQRSSSIYLVGMSINNMTDNTITQEEWEQNSSAIKLNNARKLFSITQKSFYAKSTDSERQSKIL